MKKHLSIVMAALLTLSSVSTTAVFAGTESNTALEQGGIKVDIKNPYYMWNLFEFSDSNAKEWTTTRGESVDKVMDNSYGRTLEIGDGSSAELYVSKALDTWDGSSVDTSWYSDEADEFTIYTAAELAGLSKLVSSGKTFVGKTVTLASDIDLNNHPWIPIGRDNDKYFGGTFCGKGSIVKNVTITTDKSIGDGVGLFGVCGYYKWNAPAATIKSTVTQLGVENVTVSLNYTISNDVSVGGLAGKMTGNMSDCFARNISIYIGDSSTADTAVAEKFARVAPLIGLMGVSTVVENCYAVNFESDTSCQDIVGGICGHLFGLTDAESYLRNSYCAGNYSVRYRYNGNEYTYSKELMDGIKSGDIDARPIRFYQIGSTGKYAANFAENAYCALELPACNVYRDLYSMYASFIATTNKTTVVAADKLKTYAAVLGENFADDENEVNEGYPIFAYDKISPDADSTVSFDFYVPSGAEITAYVRNGAPNNHIAALSTVDYAAAVKYDEWNKADIVLDGHGNYAVSVNGTKFDAVPYDGSGTGINYIGFSADGGYARVDNVCVKSDLTSEINGFAQGLEKALEGVIADYPNVNEGFVLPYGDGSFNVLWSSSNESVISADASVVNSKAYAQSVEMTASAMRNSACTNGKPVEFCVKIPLNVPSSGDELTIDDIIDNYLVDKNLTNEDISRITKDISLPSSLDSAVITWASSNEEVLSSAGVVNRKLNEDVTVTLTATAEFGGDKKTKAIEFTVISTETMIKAAMNELGYADLTDQSKNSITKDVVLPLSGLYGTQISWSTSDENVMTAVGCICPVDKSSSVVLTASFSLDGITLEKEFSFVVTKSDEEKVNIDADGIALDEFVEDNFDLPLVGEFFGTDIEWTSDNDCISISNGRAIVTRPEYGQGDASVTLTARVSVNQASTERQFTVIVREMPTDEALVDEMYEQLSWSNISGEKADSVTQNLAFPAALKFGVTCEWKSLTPEYLNDGGVINRPQVGKEDVTAIAEATLRKGNAVKTKKFTFTVKAFFENDQVLAKAKNELTFDKLSDEPVSVVTKNLSLPTQWRYGTLITWKSSDESVIKIENGTDGCVGTVTRPQYNAGNKKVELTAKIGFNGEYTDKVFSVFVSEERGNVAVVNETFNDMERGGFNGSTRSEWSAYLGYETFDVVEDPDDADNNVLRFARSADVVSASSMPEFGVETPKYQGEFVVKYRLKIESLSSFPLRNYYRFDSENGANKMLLDIRFEKNGNAADLKVSTNDKNNVTGKFQVTFGQWHDVEVRISTFDNTVSIYMDNKEIMPEFILQTNPYTCSFKKTLFKHGYAKAGVKPDIDHVALFDDVQILRVVDSSKDLVTAMKNWNLEFLTSQNIAAVTDNLILPDISAFETTISCKSSDRNVISDAGKVTRGDKDQTVEYTVTFANDWGGYREKTYYINVKAIGSDGSDPGLAGDALDVLNDADELETMLNSSYTMNYITSHMSLPTSGANGTTVTWQSSNESVLSNSGIVTRGTSDSDVVLYMTVTKNGASDIRRFDIKVKKTAVSTESGGSVSSGGGRPKGNGAGIGGTTVPDGGSNNETTGDVFSDISGHWAHDIIVKMNKLGFADGVGSGIFDADSPMTREQFVKMLLEVMDIDERDSDPNMKFADADPDAWYAPYVEKAYEMGLVKGISDSEFGIGRYISREDMCVIVASAANLNNGDESAPNVFADYGDIADYARASVFAMKERGLVSGKPGGVFDPKGTATRAEAAKILYEFYMMNK